MKRPELTSVAEYTAEIEALGSPAIPEIILNQRYWLHGDRASAETRGRPYMLAWFANGDLVAIEESNSSDSSVIKLTQTLHMMRQWCEWVMSLRDAELLVFGKKSF